MASSSVLQCLITLTCLALATQAAAPHSYRSLKTVISNLHSAKKIDEKCLPTCANSNGDPIESAHIRDPSRCDQYWVCLPSGELFDQPHECPVGEIVNINDLVCEPIINDGSSQCTIPDPDCDPNIPKLCVSKETCPPSNAGLFAYADEADCYKYHVCHFDATISCENGLYFNGQECVDDKTQCCECQAVCSEAWSFIPNPSDSKCQSYYLCQDLEAGGYPYIATEEEKLICPDEQVFDESTGLCSESATCTAKANCV